ncbi:MAG: methylated-DNA-[protein]-cysteine S-methyltransferase [Chloroflexota bacterium]|jgi:methylated-DNA-[protein]-cysteine S-methyltransferase|nr:methylated-DNA-[protein]-cysteine S-methyltransferase [Chloroflexota bacterium]
MPDHAAIRTSVPGPWGPLQVAATARGIVAVESLTTETGFEAALARRLRAPVDDATETPATDPRHAHLLAAIAALEALLAGRALVSARTLRFDLDDRPAWDRRVLAAVAAVPWGRTVSYGEIARRIGSPGAARAVGGAVGRNPVSLLIPCHRVIAADGTLGGYGGGAWGTREDRLTMKRELLRREGVTVEPSDR